MPAEFFLVFFLKKNSLIIVMYFKKSKLFLYIINDPCDKKNHKLLIKNNIYITFKFNFTTLEQLFGPNIIIGPSFSPGKFILSIKISKTCHIK